MCVCVVSNNLLYKNVQPTESRDVDDDDDALPENGHSTESLSLFSFLFFLPYYITASSYNTHVPPQWETRTPFTQIKR